jgi:hypothetical protein
MNERSNRERRSLVLREVFKFVDTGAGQIFHRLVEIRRNAHVAESAGVGHPHTVAFPEADWGKQATREVALQGRE